MLTSAVNLINTARCAGQAMRLTENDIAFSAASTLGAVVKEKVAALLGVPTMFNAEFRILEAKRYCITTLRTGLAAGSPVPPSLVRSMKRERGVMGMLISFGMTEISPVTFMMSLDGSEETMSTAIGRVLPHTRTKVVDPEGNTALVGQKGLQNKWPMPVNSCFSNRGGSNWSGFTNDAVTSFRISGGCCRFYKDADCQGGPMFTECNIDVPSIHDRYGQFNDQLSSVFCY
ncbi:Acyl-CoA synthetase member 2 mitochondrial [Verticillium nonalfalfae]|uniref:Acyl-CoA synthetase member 2 mitochondrial n=1 Tax=Verticillium nonalfalfae TaxID=1051616 RepID=A0A3M9YFP5_9PEZI|nr:Acyl-CoA synthetase member 2 mitochondrial [Verticillium nonalfalfae]RNJ59393.1 Acyl-CoA synthetase member 2 mitochondrial [Verticillium nonalfalfae]